LFGSFRRRLIKPLPVDKYKILSAVGQNESLLPHQSLQLPKHIADSSGLLRGIERRLESCLSPKHNQTKVLSTSLGEES
jgi:hypothetical protein